MMSGPLNTSWHTCMNAANNAYKKGAYDYAERMFRAALNEAEDFGPDDPRLAKNMNNLALVYYAQGKYAEAELLFERSLALWKKVMGRDHPDVATSLNNLAGLYDAQGKYAEAVPLHKLSLAMREKLFGRDHPDVAESLNDLARLY